MKTRKCMLCLFIVSLAFLRGNGQASFPEILSRQFSEYTERSIPEKVFVHTDKNFYIAGEIIWLKVYAVDGLLHRPLDLSKVTYVELLDRSDKPALQAKLAMKRGSGSGSLYLPPALNSGTYTLRAYTNWMKNFGAAYFFEKTITIVNGKKTYTEEKRSPAPQYDVQFFPEGGNLVNGLQSRVGFRVVDRFGRGIDCKGILLDDLSDTITSFEPLHAGLGNFLLSPKSGRQYSATLTIPGFGQLIKQLPAAYDNGYVLQVSQPVGGKIKVGIQAAFKDGSPGREAYFFAHTRGLVKSATAVNISGGQAELQLDLAALGDGVSHFTLFNADRQPVCERLFFKYPTQRLQISMNAGEEYGARKKVEIDFATKGNDNQPLAADLSMAVYRLDSLQPIDAMDITTYLWLSADLAGAVESPEYYFESPLDVSRANAMDNLMLTHGWRRFAWKDIVGNAKPSFEFLPEYNGHFITGKIASASTQAPGAVVPAFISSPGRRTQFREATGNDSGHVRFEMKDFYGEEVVVQTNGQKDSAYRVTLSDPFFRKYSAKFSSSSFSITSLPRTTLLERYIGAQAQNVYSGNRLSQFDLPAIDSLPFYVKPDVSYILDNYTRFTTFEEILREYVPLVFVRKRAGRFHFAIFERVNRTLFSLDPLVLLDGVPVFNIDKFMKYDPLKVWKLDLVARNYFYGDLAFEGILNFITYRGDLPDVELDPNATVIDYEGLQLQREFFSPVYDVPGQAAGRAPDLRNLLFWSPEIQTSGKANGRISFFTSDLSGKYAAVLQGLSADGRPGRQTIMFEVKEGEK